MEGEVHVYIPLSENLPPVANSFERTLPTGLAVIPGIINGNTDPNNNIHYTDGFIMVDFPEHLGIYTFSDGTLTVDPTEVGESSMFLITYQLCDLAGACSGNATIELDYTDKIGPNPPVVVHTPVPTPVFIYYYPIDFFDSSTSSSSALSASLL